jgi:hypothetical protein
VSESGQNRTATAELVAELKAILAKSVSGNVGLAVRVRDLVRGLAADAPGAVRDPGKRRELVARWLAFNVASLRALTDASLDTMNAIVAAAEKTLLTPAQEQAPAPEQPGAVAAIGDGAIDIVLEGRLGDRIRAPFLLENFYDRALDVTFDVEPFRAPDQPALPASLLAVDPTTLQLPAKGQAVVHAVVDLVDAFVPEVTYATVIRLAGYDARTMRLSVKVAGEKTAA